MTIAIDWDVKNRTKPKNLCCVLELDPLSGRCLVMVQPKKIRPDMIEKNVD